MFRLPHYDIVTLCRYALASCSRINERARIGRAAIMQKLREGSSFKDMAKWLIYEEFGGMDAAL
jgi:hypothetical protein